MRFGKALIAEFIGTFALIFIGAGAVISLAPGDFAAIGLAHGFVIMAFAYAFGNESGSYVNPALSVAVALSGERPWKSAVPVIGAQLAGGIVGGLTLLAIYGRGAPNHLGATLIDTSRTSVAGGLLLEAIGTFFLATIVLNTAVRKTAGQFAPFAIGMTVAFCIMSFGAITGGSLNPARTLGPAIASGSYAHMIGYIVAQLFGAAVAAMAFRFLWNRETVKEAKEKAEQGEEPAF